MNPNLIMKPCNLSHIVSMSLPACDLSIGSFYLSQVSRAILTNWDGLSSISNNSGLNVLRSDIPMSRTILNLCSLKNSLNSASLINLVTKVQDLVNNLVRFSLSAIRSPNYGDAVSW